MARRISAEVAAKGVKLELPDSEYAVTARSMLGSNVVLPADSQKEAQARARELCICENHMVCILENGERVARWDRINAGGGYLFGEHTPHPKENRWRRSLWTEANLSAVSAKSGRILCKHRKSWPVPAFRGREIMGSGSSQSSAVSNWRDRANYAANE